MRMMAILLGVTAFVYFVTGLKGGLSKKKRLYLALGTYLLAYLITMISVFFGGEL